MMPEQQQPLSNLVAALIARAANTNDSGDAMRFSQAAVNAANAMCALATAGMAGIT